MALIAKLKHDSPAGWNFKRQIEKEFIYGDQNHDPHPHINH